MKKLLVVGVIVLFLGLAIAPSINANVFRENDNVIENLEQDGEKENYNCTIIAIAKPTYMRYPDDSFPLLTEIGDWILENMVQGFPPLILMAIVYLGFAIIYESFDMFVYPFTRWPVTLTFGERIDEPSQPLLNKETEYLSNAIFPWRPARGFVWTNGTNGVVTWAGMFWGDLGVLNTPGHTKNFIGVEGFEGFKFSRFRNAYDVYIGTAKHVKMTYEWPGWWPIV